MKYLLIIFIVTILQSCFETPVDPPEEEPTELVQLWSYNHGIVGDAPPVISEDIIFASGGLYLYALNEKTGELMWKAQIDDNSELQGRILLLKDDQIVANHLENIRGWNTTNGQLEWEYVYSNDLEPRLIGNHVVTNEGYAFNATHGKFFVLDEQGNLMLEKQLDRNYMVQGLAYYQGTLFVGQKQTVTGALTLGRITALNAETGDSLWVYNTENGGFSWTAPIVENGILYASTQGNSPLDDAVALDAETGEVIWKYESDYLYTRAATLGPIHYYVNTGGSLAALSKENGELQWRVEWLGTDFNKPVYLEGFVYHVRDGEMLVIDDSTGNVVHREPVPEGGSYFWHVAASKDKIFAQTSRQLIAYQPWHLRED